MYRIDDDLEVRFSTKKLPLEYKLLEWRLIINRQLYEKYGLNKDEIEYIENLIKEM